MSKATFWSRLRGGLFLGAIGLMPAVALADSGTTPSPEETGARATDQATVESRGGATEVRINDPAAAHRATDHASVQSRGASDEVRSSLPADGTVPDHNAAQGRAAD